MRISTDDFLHHQYPNLPQLKIKRYCENVMVFYYVPKLLFWFSQIWWDKIHYFKHNFLWLSFCLFVFLICSFKWLPSLKPIIICHLEFAVKILFGGILGRMEIWGEKIEEKEFLVGVWLGEGGGGPGCFFPGPTKMFSPQNGEKTMRGKLNLLG